MQRADGRLRKGRRAASEPRLGSREEIQRTLAETILAILDGRITDEEALKIGMLAEERILALNAAEGSGGAKRWLN